MLTSVHGTKRVAFGVEDLGHAHR